MSATNRGATRVHRDSYQTPHWCIELLNLHVIESLAGHSFKAHEPCIGEGRIPHHFPNWNWTGDDLLFGSDYLKAPYAPNSFDIIITNPPFSLAQSFLEKSLKESYLVIYLLRLNFLGSQKRHSFWQSNPPTHLFPLSRRPSFTADGKTDATDYGWFAWDRISTLSKPRGIYVL